MRVAGENVQICDGCIVHSVGVTADNDVAHATWARVVGAMLARCTLEDAGRLAEPLIRAACALAGTDTDVLTELLGILAERDGTPFARALLALYDHYGRNRLG